MNSEPTEGAGMIEALAWLEVNKKRLAVGAVIALVVGFAIYVWGYMADQKEVNASAALIRLKTSANANTNQPVAPASEFLKVAQENSGTSAAERALLLGATALFTEGKYAEAQTQFNKMIQEHPGSPWVSEAAYGIAASQEALGKQDEALTGYQKVVQSYGGEPVANEARLALGRIYEAKKQPELALKQYDELAKPGAMSSMSRISQDAMIRRNKLLTKYPNLKPAPVAPTAMMGANGAPVMSAAPAGTNKPAAPATAPSTNKPAAK